MAGDTFRSNRSRDLLARGDADPTAREAAGDPLAELARLIGQGDPYAEGRHKASASKRWAEEPEAAAVDWAADESYAAQRDHGEDRYVAPPPSSPNPAYAPPSRDYANESAPSDRYFSGPAANFNGFREEPDADYVSEEDPASAERELDAFMAATAAPVASSENHEADAQEYDGGEAYASDDHYENIPSRRSGLAVVMAVFGLAVIGTAGALGYRYVLGGPLLPTLPPIIKASSTPTKILPGSGQSPAKDSSPNIVAGMGTTEKLISHEEQPVNMEPPSAAPRVVSAIPITSDQNSASGAPSPAVSGVTTPSPPAPSPVAGQSAASSPGGTAPTPNAAPTAPPAPAPSVTASEPKKVHTVSIRADQPSGSGAVPPQPAPAARSAATRSMSTAAKSSPSAGAPSGDPNAPLSIIAAAETAAPAPSRKHTAAAPIGVASVEPAAAATSQPSGAGYHVQVSSQRTEAEAQASFKELQAKFPQLNGRQPIIRRADLGAKGTYYRALVGPFASMEEAAAMCSGLKAAGGSCIVQKN
jgi:hypothetical protein